MYWSMKTYHPSFAVAPRGVLVRLAGGDQGDSTMNRSIYLLALSIILAGTATAAGRDNDYCWVQENELNA